MRDLLHLGGYGAFVWGSYGMLALAIVIELIALRRRRARAWQEASQLEREAQP